MKHRFFATSAMLCGTALLCLAELDAERFHLSQEVRDTPWMSNVYEAWQTTAPMAAKTARIASNVVAFFLRAFFPVPVLTGAFLLRQRHALEWPHADGD